jgi:hypothetical protein
MTWRAIFMSFILVNYINLTLATIDHFSLSLVLNISGFFTLSKGEFLSFSPKIAYFSYNKSSFAGLTLDLPAYCFKMYAEVLKTGEYDGRTNWG